LETEAILFIGLKFASFSIWFPPLFSVQIVRPSLSRPSSLSPTTSSCQVDRIFLFRERAELAPHVTGVKSAREWVEKYIADDGGIVEFCKSFEETENYRPNSLPSNHIIVVDVLFAL